MIYVLGVKFVDMFEIYCFYLYLYLQLLPLSTTHVCRFTVIGEVLDTRKDVKGEGRAYED